MSHTHGDGWAWLPEERILFSGDAAVNGPHNFVGDGDTRAWPATLEKAQALRPRIVGVGHGPLGDGSVLEDQKSFFETLHRVVSEERRAGRSAADLQGRIESLRARGRARTSASRAMSAPASRRKSRRFGSSRAGKRSKPRRSKCTDSNTRRIMSADNQKLTELVEHIRDAERVLVFTGAGISTGSGIRDFRGPKGVWKERQPVYFQDFMTSQTARDRVLGSEARGVAVVQGRRAQRRPRRHRGLGACREDRDGHHAEHRRPAHVRRHVRRKARRDPRDERGHRVHELPRAHRSRMHT